jgi:hypothetical protein
MKISYQSASGYRYEPVWDEYGRTLEAQCRRVLRADAGIYRVPASEEEIATALARPAALTRRFRAVAAKAAADGASVTLPGPAFLATLPHLAGLTEVEGAPVLDTVAIAVKTAEMRVDLQRAGVAPSRRIGVYCKPDPAFANAALARLDPVFRTR